MEVKAEGFHMANCSINGKSEKYSRVKGIKFSVNVLKRKA